MVRSRWFSWFPIAVLAICVSAAEAVQLGLPEVTAAPGERVRVPLQIDVATGETILSGNLDIRFDASILVADSIAVDRTGSRASSWIVAANPRLVPDGGARDGQALIGAATARNQITESGTFFFLELLVAESAPIGSTSPLSFASVFLNNGQPTASTVDGLLTVSLPELKADFTAAPLEGAVPLEVQFQDRSSTDGVDAYLWDFGDGETSAERNPRHIYEEAGSFTVSLTVSGPPGETGETKEDYIQVAPDQRPPDIIEGPIALGTTHNATTIFWETNELSDSQVQYCGLDLRPRLGSMDELIAALEEDLDVEECRVDGGNGGGTAEGGERGKPVAKPGSDTAATLFGGLRLKNFSSGPGGEIYLGDGELSDRVEQDFYRSRPCGDAEEVYGAWQESNRISLSYDPGTGVLRTDVEASHSYCREYALGDVGRLDYMQIDVVSRQNGATVKLKNVRLDGQQLGSFTSSGWQTWTVDEYDLSEGFTLEGDLELKGAQPDGETNKVQITFGRRNGDGGGEGDCGDLVRQWLLQGKLPHFDEGAADLFPLIAHCGEAVEEEPVLDHEVPLSGLSPYSFYVYRVRSADADGNQSAWKGGFFLTQARPDDEPPRIVLGPQATPAADRALITWETDEPGNSFVQYGTDENFQDAERLLVDELVYRHEVWLEGLAENATYYYRVRSSDASGNASTLKRGNFRTTGSDGEPPAIWNGPRVTLRTPYKAMIEWKTDEPSSSRVEFGTGEEYGRFAEEDRLVQDHSVLLTHLDPQTLYHYRVSSTDASGNQAVSEDQTFVTRGNADTRPCGIVRQPYVIKRFHDRVIIGWGLDEVGRGHIEFGRTEEYGKVVELPEFARDHTLTLTGLSPGTRYFCRVHMVDLEGNGPTISRRLEFWTDSKRDNEKPIFAGQPVVRERTDSQATLAWITDEASDSYVDYGTDSGYGHTAGSPELVREHEVRLTGLSPGASYHFRVRSTDAAGNGPSFSGDYTFSTRPAPDEEPPIIIAGPSVTARSKDSAVIEWWTDELTDGVVDYGTGLVYGSETFSDRFDQVHRVHLAQLQAGTTYHFQVSSTDAAGNGPVSSRDLTFTTKGKGDDRPPKIRGVSVRKVTDDAALIEWSTDEPADSAIDYGRSTNYGERLEAPELVREHQMRLSGLELNTTYHFRVASTDIDGNEEISRDRDFRTDGEEDHTPPVVIGGPEIVASHSTATFIWRTSEPCFSRVIVGSEESFGTPAERIFESLQAGERHSITITGLKLGTRYLFSLISRDLKGNETAIGEPRRRVGKIVRPLATDGTISFVTASEPDFAAPTIVDGPHLLSRTDDEALISWTTDEIGDSRLFVERNGQLALEEFIPDHDFEHRVQLTGLEPGTTYRAKVASADPAGNGPTQSALFTFTTSTGADLLPPSLVGQPAVVEVGDRVVSIAWETDEASSSEVVFGIGESTRTQVDPELVTEHRVQLTDLEPATTYRFRVRSYDAQENGPVESDFASFTTAATPDVQAPTIVVAPAVEELSDRSAVVVWETDEAADGFVRYGTDEALDYTTGRAELTTAHRVVLSHLQPSTTYRFAVASADRAGNGPTESETLSLTTLAQADATPPPVPSELLVRDADGMVLLEWTGVEAEDLVGYNVYRTGGEVFTRIAGPVTETTYRDQGLEASGDYRYQVTAVDRAGNESATSAARAVAVEARRPGDFQGDGQVGFDDFFMLAERFGLRDSDRGFSSSFDLDEDGQVGFDDFFLFVDLFGTTYRSGRAAIADSRVPFQPELHLEEGRRAGEFTLTVAARASRSLKGYGLRLAYDPAQVRFVGAEDAGADFATASQGLFGVLEDRDGRLSLGGHLARGAAFAGEGVLTRLHFAVEPAVASAPVRLTEIAGIDAGGGFASAGLGSEGIQVRLTPVRYSLDQNAPNPFNPQTEIRFRMPRDGRVALRVHDLLGQVVAVLADEELSAGFHRVVWDGRDMAGRDVASGVYFYTMETGGFRQTRKLMLLR